jgi:hypothetical protein
MRILQLIVSGTLANAGRPERVKTKQNKNQKSQMHLIKNKIIKILNFRNNNLKKFIISFLDLVIKSWITLIWTG